MRMYKAGEVYKCVNETEEYGLGLGVRPFIVLDVDEEQGIIHAVTTAYKDNGQREDSKLYLNMDYAMQSISCILADLLFTISFFDINDKISKISENQLEAIQEKVAENDLNNRLKEAFLSSKEDSDDYLLEQDDEKELINLQYLVDNNKPLFEVMRVIKKDFSLFELHRKHQKDQLILDVSFQRKNVWDLKQKCELIESILMGLPLPIFYFKQQSNSTYVVVDGKQRLTTIFEYFNDGFRLKNLRVLRNLERKKFSELQGEYSIYQSQLEDYQIYSHVILPPTPDQMIFEIFDRVNRGGTQLNKQEIRNALYQGAGLELVKRLACSKAFTRATRIEPRKDTRMKGAYLITRYLAFYLYFDRLLTKDGVSYIYSGDVDELIGVALKQLNTYAKDQLEVLYDDSVRYLDLANELLGEGAFRRELDRSKPINMNIFETSMYLMSILNKEVFDKDRVNILLRDVIMGADFINTLGNSRDNVNNVSVRFGLMRKLAEGIIHDSKN